MIIILEIIIVYLISASAHEYAHSDIAYRLGDNTAKLQGRSSLNPLRHITLYGFKSVPVRHLNCKRDYILFHGAGIVVNLLLALVSLFFVSILIFKITLFVNLWIVVINIIPIKCGSRSNDGYKILQHIKHNR